MVEYFPPVVFWRRPPFARKGRLFASGYLVLFKKKSLGIIIWVNFSHVPLPTALASVGVVCVSLARFVL